MPTRPAVAATLAALAALALTACSSEPDKGATQPAKSAPATDPTAEEAPADPKAAEDDALEQSVRDYAKALFAPDGKKGYALVSKRCKTQMTAADFDDLAKTAHHDHGALTVKNVSVDQMSGDMARVSYGVGVPQFERKAQPWTKEGGVWKWDACQIA